MVVPYLGQSGPSSSYQTIHVSMQASHLRSVHLEVVLAEGFHLFLNIFNIVQ